jgi:hypothetical protein
MDANEAELMEAFIQSLRHKQRGLLVIGLVGLLMPLGIWMELYLGASPIFVLIGAISMTSAVALSGALALRSWGADRPCLPLAPPPQAR